MGKMMIEERDNRFLRANHLRSRLRQPARQLEVEKALDELIKETRQKIDESFSKEKKYPAKLKQKQD